MSVATSRVYAFDAPPAVPSEARKALLGGKGASLAGMTAAGLPVPPGFTITTEACRDYLATGELPAALLAEISAAVDSLQQATGRRLGDPDAPLLLSVRSGAPISMPGMMDTVLNLGLTPATMVGLGRLCGDDFTFARDSYRRFLESYGSVVLGISLDRFEAVAEHARLNPTDEDEVRSVIYAYRDLLREAGHDLPDDAQVALVEAIRAVFDSWNSPRARTYRELESIPDTLGTAVNVQAMVFGNLDDRSGTGVVFTRDPNTGAREPYGDFLFNAQGEDVVSGRRVTLPLADLGEALPEVAAELQRGCDLLEARIGDMADIEFTVESGRLYFLQVRRGKRAAVAAVRIAVELADEGLITREEAVGRITPRDLTRLRQPYLDPTADYEVLTTGLNASPGVATGAICTDADRVMEMIGDGDVILVRAETSPTDVHGMALARGILTARGGLVSHAAVVARDMGTPAVVGALDLVVDAAARTVTIGDLALRDGDVITIDGGTGEVVRGGVATIEPQPGEHVTTLLAWADEIAGDDASPTAAPQVRLQAAHATLSGRDVESYNLST